MSSHEWMIDVLKRSVDYFHPVVLEKTLGVLEEREKKLLNFIFEEFYSLARLRGRWYDLYHIPFSTLCAAEEQGFSHLILSGVELHDIGYYRTITNDSRDPQSRITHMQEGAVLTIGILAKNGYSPTEIETVAGMVATHDNHYFGIPVEDPDRRAVVDADRAFVMHFISFWKDFASQKELSPLELFRSRTFSFYGDIDPPSEKWGSPRKITQEDKVQAGNIPANRTFRELRDRQFWARWEEVQQWEQGKLKNASDFRIYAEWHISRELAAGRA